MADRDNLAYESPTKPIGVYIKPRKETTGKKEARKSINYFKNLLNE